MKVLVISDSHLKLERLVTIFNQEKPEVVLCAGDHSRDGEELSYVCPEAKYYIVRGNCDIFDRRYEDELIIELEGLKILLAHGHKYSVKYDYSLIEQRGRDLNCDIVIFGHTHIQYLSQKKGITLFNPGAVYGREYGLLDIENGSFKLYHKCI